MTIDIGRTGADVGFKRRVVVTDALPIARQRLQASRRDATIPLGMLQRCDDRPHARLRGQPTHRVERSIHRIHPSLNRRQHAGHCCSTGIVRMKVNRQAHFFFQRPHQRLGRLRPADPGHVFDTDDVRAGPL